MSVATNDAIAVYAADAPGMPHPGPAFTELAEARQKKHTAKNITQQLTWLYDRALQANSNFTLSLQHGTTRVPRTLIGGHLWGNVNRRGPQPSRVMVVGKMLGEDEIDESRHFCGPTGQLLLDTLRHFSVRGLAGWYVTNVLKCQHPAKKGGETQLKAAWLKDFLPLLQEELRMVRPDYILCLGADAIKAFLGKTATLRSIEGRVIEYRFPVHRRQGKKERFHTSLLMGCLHPVQVLKAAEMTEQFEDTISRFGQLTQGVRWDKRETGLDHRIITSELELKALINEIEHTPEAYQPQRPGDKPQLVIGIDAEWNGEHPQNKNGYLRTIQISWKHKTAACIVLRKAGGEPLFHGGPYAAVRLLKRLLKSNDKRGVRLVGHFLVADMEWLLAEGLDLTDEFKPAANWEDTEFLGGYDTGYGAHALKETDEFGLSYQLLRHCGIPRYDVALEEWKAAHCKKLDIKPKDLEGYGDCPGEVLYQYANYDADGTRRLYWNQQKRLNYDMFGNNCREAFWLTMKTALPILEMKMTGICVDWERIEELTSLYLRAKNELRDKLREWAKWPTLNLESSFQVRELLFGTAYNGKKPMENGRRPRQRPAGARSLRLKPLLTTGKRPQLWDEAMQNMDDGDDEPTAGSNKTVLSIMAEESQAVKVYSARRGRWVTVDKSGPLVQLRNYRFIGQILKSVLREPVKVEKSDEYLMRGGRYVYAKGLPAAVCDDGKVRTTLYPTKETYRWSSSRPPLQNFSSRREADYKRILAELYKYPLRSLLRAEEGHVLIEADIVGAELFGAAIMSGDKLMIEHCQRNQLPEDHPDHYDFHSQNCVHAFRYNCPPTKAGLASIGKSHMRVPAKAVLFGLMYGRGAKAIALAAKEEGVIITVEEAQALIDAIFQRYPRLGPFFEKCRERAIEKRWMCGAFGQFRRFPLAYDQRSIGDIERQGMNFPIQNFVAGAMDNAVFNLYDYRKDYFPADLDYRLLLAVHDSALLQVPYKFVDKVMTDVLPEAMCRMVPLYPCKLNGMPINRGPYYFAVDAKVYLSWGVKITQEECKERGIPIKYGSAPKKAA